ncbi:hypothetical protein IEQ34_023033 [Dendrobium chrysotoxum]|uniref:Uncharacterized protein n=1 Tax=Dendrobium chrysotoxum TaxID=161865 RepID=A0AAV7G0K4_DENCH|nr:hypothetical protein IEQ34_023033 [Dendrobium chrysotoxum]
MEVNHVSLNDLGFLDGKNKYRSFKDALSGSSSSVIFPDLKATTHGDKTTLWISEEEAENLTSFCFLLKQAENLDLLADDPSTETLRTRDNDRRRQLRSMLGVTFVNTSQTPPHKIFSLSPKLSLSPS